MIKKTLLLAIIIFLLIPTSLFANNEVSSVAQNWFDTFFAKINKQYNIDNQIIYFKGLSQKLENFKQNKKIRTTQIILINDLIKLSNEYTFKLERGVEENHNKITLETNKLLKKFNLLSYNSENIFLEKGIWYTYKVDGYLTIPKGITINQKDLEYNGINTSTSLVFLTEDNELGFASKYEKIKLISDSIIYGIPDKYNFLKEVKDDKKKLNQETDNAFNILKEITNKITNGKIRKEKIKAIYSYVLNNVQYTEGFSFDNPEISSGINTFANKNGICEGYAKIFMYMLNFANINDTKVIRGYVLDAVDFPTVGHAWVKIGDKYYDPTFDDPIGQISTKKYIEYKYFGLPYDLFYTNRYTFEKIPSFLKEKDLTYRKKFIIKRTIPMVHKYKYSGYNLIKPYVLKLEYGIKLDENINIEDFKKIVEYYEIDEANWSIVKNGITKKIINIKYYNINNSNIDNIIEQLNYNFKGYYLFKWKLDNGSYEYRLSYDVKFL